MLNYKYKFLSNIIISLSLSSVIFAKTLSIQSLKSEADLKQGKMTFTGQVSIVMEKHIIKAEKVTITNKDNTIKQLEISKDIKAFINLDANNSYEIKAQKLIYKAKNKDFHFEGNVSIQDSQKSKSLKGHIVRLNEINQSIYIDGSKQAPMQVIFQLDSEK